MSSSPVPFTEIESQLDTGDIFTFHGVSEIDFLIELASEGKPYSHSGMVLKYQGTLYFWDAPGGGEIFADPFKDDQAHIGCRVAVLSDLMRAYMQNYPGRLFFWRKLTSGVSPAQYQQFLDFIQAVDGTPFPDLHLGLRGNLDKALGLLASYLSGIKFQQDVKGSYFCSQLVADTLMHMGMLETSPWPPNSYVPGDYDATSGNEFPLINNTTYGDVVEVFYNIKSEDEAEAPC